MRFCPGCGTGDRNEFRITDAGNTRLYCKRCEAEQARERRKRNGATTDIAAAFDGLDFIVTEDDGATIRDAYQATDWQPKRSHVLPRSAKSTVVCVPDIHFPWHSERGLSLCLDIISAAQPQLVIQLGDLYDLLSFSRYSRSHDLYTPADELSRGRKAAEDFWREVSRRAPGARRIQLRGNHDDRACKRVAEALPEIATLVNPVIDALFQFDGVETIQDSRMEFEYEGTLYMHGYGRFGSHAKRNLQNTVTGHLHRGGVEFVPSARGSIWELNAGFLGDHEAPVFSYHAQKKAHGTTLGVGIVDQWGPRFVPFD